VLLDVWLALLSVLSWLAVALGLISITNQNLIPS
jgi:hypothetical protein